jgi:hypothetical protein
VDWYLVHVTQLSEKKYLSRSKRMSTLYPGSAYSPDWGGACAYIGWKDGGSILNQSSSA